MVGYAVECGFKACIAKRTNLHDFPDKEFAAKIFTHNIESLVKSAALESERIKFFGVDIQLFENWKVITEWGEGSRYRFHTELKARRIVTAVTHPTRGVLPWIMGHW